MHVEKTPFAFYLVTVPILSIHHLAFHLGISVRYFVLLMEYQYLLTCYIIHLNQDVNLGSLYFHLEVKYLV